MMPSFLYVTPGGIYIFVFLGAGDEFRPAIYRLGPNSRSVVTQLTRYKDVMVRCNEVHIYFVQRKTTIELSFCQI